MTKVTNIPGRLHSVEQGNIVAGANEIYDDTKGKKQNVINSETDAELLRLEQSKQDNLTFDNAPTENSNNPVKSGGVYAADLVLQQAIEAILLLIPSAATSLNQLADRAFVNSSISTATATFRGTYNVVTDLHLAVDATHAQIETALASVVATADNNDYCYVQIPVSSSSQDIQKTSRYKFNGSAWVFEYDLNTSGFTSAQWAAINSGITAALVTKLGALPTASELSEDLQGLSTAIQGILDLIPSAATSSNKLTDKAYVDGLIQAITELIPAEATDQNQLADKAYVLAQILAATPAFKGQFTTLAALEAVSSPKAGDIGIVRTTDNDGFATFAFYQYLNEQWNVYYTLAHHLQNKPATTGTSGDYPYNGMGRVVIPKNMVNNVNTLTQDAFEDSEGNPLTNTVFVIQYDFTLGANITVPANCVLEFDGGSIKNINQNTYTIDFNNCVIKANYKVFDSVLPLQDSEFGQDINPRWFGVIDDGVTDNVTSLNYMISFVGRLGYSSITFRGNGNSYHRVVFDMTGPIRITEPVEFNKRCHVLGYPLFYYDGAHISNSGAIIINPGESNVTYELSVTSKLGNGDTYERIDLSDNIIFGGICLKKFIYGTLKVREICGFNSGILMYANGNATPACLKINPERVSMCLNTVLVNCVNEGWPNQIELYGCSVMAGSEGPIVPSGFDRGAFIKIIGDSTYGINSWDIHDNAMEGRINTTIPVDLFNNRQSVGCEYFHFHDNRIEGTYGGIKLNVKCGITYTPSQFGEMDIPLVVDNVYNTSVTTTVNSRLAMALGVYSNRLKEEQHFVRSLGSITQNWYGVGFSVTTIYNGGANPMKIFKVEPGKLFIAYAERDFERNDDGKQRLFMYFSDDSHISNMELIEAPTSDVDIYNMYKADTLYYMGNTDSGNIAMFKNNSNKNYYILVGCYNMIRLYAFGEYTEYNDGVNIINGTVRPSFYPNQCKGYKFFDEGLSPAIPIFWEGTKWVKADGTDA